MLEASGAKNVSTFAYEDRVPGYGIHEMGSARMGQDPKQSVLNQFQQSHDVKNLFVMDAAGFPSRRMPEPDAHDHGDGGAVDGLSDGASSRSGISNKLPETTRMPKHRIFTTSFAKVYPMYVQKAERKGRTKKEVDQIIRWLTGYSADGLRQQIKSETDFETFFAQAPAMNPQRALSKAWCAASAWRKSRTR